MVAQQVLAASSMNSPRPCETSRRRRGYLPDAGCRMPSSAFRACPGRFRVGRFRTSRCFLRTRQRCSRGGHRRSSEVRSVPERKRPGPVDSERRRRRRSRRSRLGRRGHRRWASISWPVPRRAFASRPCFAPRAAKRARTGIEPRLRGRCRGSSFGVIVVSRRSRRRSSVRVLSVGTDSFGWIGWSLRAHALGLTD
jgi:hypothetical protein